MTKTDEGFAAYPQRAYVRAKPRFYPSYGKRALDIGLVLLALPAVLVPDIFSDRITSHPAALSAAS